MVNKSKTTIGLRLDDKDIDRIEEVISKWGGSKAGLCKLLVVKCLDVIGNNSYPYLIARLDAFEIVE